MVSFCLHSHGELSNQSQFYDAITGLSCWGGMVNTETMSIFDSIKRIKFQGLWYLLLTLLLDGCRCARSSISFHMGFPSLAELLQLQACITIILVPRNALTLRMKKMFMASMVGTGRYLLGSLLFLFSTQTLSKPHLLIISSCIHIEAWKQVSIFIWEPEYLSCSSAIHEA